MFCRAIGRHKPPKYLSSDHNPLYRFHQWQANVRVLEVKEIKPVPYVSLSHPVVKRLIGKVRREYLDRILFWTTADLEQKPLDFRHYYSRYRVPALAARVPEPMPDGSGFTLSLDACTVASAVLSLTTESTSTINMTAEGFARHYP